MPAINDDHHGAPASTPLARRHAAQAGTHADARRLARGLLRAAALWCLAALPALALLLDIQWLGNAVGEQSLVESTQLALIVLTAGAFGALGQRRPGERRFALLAAALFACMAIRETDAAWDLVFDGLWQVLVATVALAAVAYALADWRATLRAMARFVSSRPGLVMTLALGILLIHSRLLGMGVIWEGLLDEQYLRVFKNAVEETTELLAYVLISASGLVYVARHFGSSRPGRKRTPAPDDLESTC